MCAVDTIGEIACRISDGDDGSSHKSYYHII
jgi:hypothetical protein